MSTETIINKTYRVAIIGSGPAGFFAADHLFKNKEISFEIDMYDKLPNPHGLVRSGVAPDHQKIKSVIKVYDKIAENPNFRFYGLIEFGKDINIDDLKKHYHQIIFATGAQTDRRMNIPGEDLNRSFTATDFVAWYNGHPEYSDRDFDLNVEKVAIVGMGNVAVDVARILCRTKDELLKTDIADYALEKLANSKIKEVYMLGRRGPAQAAFTNPEIKELNNLEDADLLTLPDEVEIDNFTKEFLESNPDRSTDKKIELLKEFSSNTSSKSKKLEIRFLVSPVEIIGDAENNVKAIKLVRNELYKSENGSIRPKATDSYEILDVDIVFRSIGYYGIPLPGVPFNQNWGTIPNEQGRVIHSETNKPVPGVYATGWIKRGPTGVIGTNKTDSQETVKLMIEDIENKNIFSPELPSSSAVEKLIRSRKPDYISYEDWLKIDNKEKEMGEKEGRPRKKFTSVSDMLNVLKK